MAIFKNLSVAQHLILNSVLTAVSVIGTNLYLYEQADDLSLSLVIISNLPILIFIILSKITLSNITPPIEQIVNVIEKASANDFTQRCNLTSKSEIGMLAQNIDQFIDNMNHFVNQVDSASQQLMSSSTSNNTAINSAMTALDDQRQETVSVASAMTEMEHSVGEVANSANITLEKVKEVEHAANTGREVMNNNISTTHELSSKLGHSSKVISEVETYSNNIGSILDVIRGIAEQTNLLALNAAIEAARAGEQGRGFAVVADEVRVLAQKTTSSTAEIQQMIENLQSSSQRAVEVMTECSTEMESSIAQTSDANGAMEEIQGIIAQISEMSSQIATAAAQQQTTSTEISSNLNRITALADQNYTGIEQVTAVTGDINLLVNKQNTVLSQFTLREPSEEAVEG